MTTVKPMKAQAAKLAEAGRCSGPGWVMQIKLDGCRATWHIRIGGSKLRNDRSGDRTQAAPELAEADGDVLGLECVLDGEFLAPATADEVNAPITRTSGWFNSGATRAGMYRMQFGPAIFAAFDVIEVDGQPVTGETYRARRDRLEVIAAAILAAYPECGLWLLPELPADPGTVEAVLAAGFEGVVAKREDSVYVPGGRTSGWVKIKALATIDVILTGAVKAGEGWRTGTAGAVEVAVFGPDGILVPVGYCAVKPTDAKRITRLAELGELAGIVWEVEANGIVAGKLRHPRYKRTRTDKTASPEDCGHRQLDVLPVAA